MKKAVAPADLVAEAVTLPLFRIYPNPDQPRKEFDQDALEELAANISQYGVLQPPVVVKTGENYMIIAGERRWRASHLAGRTDIPVRIVDVGPEMVEELALLENLLRRDLNIMEEARAFQTLLDRGLSEEELAAKLGFKQSWRVSERTSLLNLATDYQHLVITKALGPSQAFEMSRLPRGQQPLVFRKIRGGELGSYAKLRAFVDALLGVGDEEEMFTTPADVKAERELATKLEKMLEKVAAVVCSSFHDNELVALKKMRQGNLDLNLQRVDLTIQHLTKIKKALTEATMRRDAVGSVAA